MSPSRLLLTTKMKELIAAQLSMQKTELRPGRKSNRAAQIYKYLQWIIKMKNLIGDAS